MLTSTCDSCHETTSFEDHLAGMNIRCNQCGQGWVRVPSAAGVTASVPIFAEKGPAMPPDTATTDQRPVTRSTPLFDGPPAAAACPRCGSAAFTRGKTKRVTAPIQVRECKECGERYATIPAPMSGAVKTGMYASGVVLILGGVLAVVIGLAAMQEPSTPRFSTMPLYGVIFSAIMAFNLLSMPQRTQQLREKRLQEYQASAPPGAPPPVEIPLPPDTVALSTWFGVLSLVAPLVSSLLTVVVFGPAAIVCGIVALAQGHVKGSIGFLLGAAGLIIWGLVFVYVFQG